MIWHPAETAPRDGTIILAWFPGMDWPEAAVWIDYPAKHREYGIGFWAYANVLLESHTDGPSGEPRYWTPITKPEGKE